MKGGVAAWMLQRFRFGGKLGHETLHFLCKVARAGNESYLVCAAGAAAVVLDPIGSASVFCNEWCVVE